METTVKQFSGTLERVVSTTVLSCGYDKDTRIARVVYSKGLWKASKKAYSAVGTQQTYDYHDVPEGEYQRMRNAEHIGSYIHFNWKNVFPYRQVIDGEKAAAAKAPELPGDCQKALLETMKTLIPASYGRVLYVRRLM